MTTNLDPPPVPLPRGSGKTRRRSLRSEAGARPGEHPGRFKSPLVKVAGLAWLEFEEPDLDRAGRSGTDFGFTWPTGCPAGTSRAARSSTTGDPDQLMFEHYTDGGVFDAAIEPGWARCRSAWPADHPQRDLHRALAARIAGFMRSDSAVYEQ